MSSSSSELQHDPVSEAMTHLVGATTHLLNIPLDSLILPYFHIPSSEMNNLRGTCTQCRQSVKDYENTKAFKALYNIDKLKYVYDIVRPSSSSSLDLPPPPSSSSLEPSPLEPSSLFKFTKLVIESGALPYISSLPLNPLNPTILVSAIFAALLNPPLRPKVSPYIDPIRLRIGIRLEYSQFGTLQNNTNGFRGRDIPMHLELTQEEIRGWMIDGLDGTIPQKANEIKRICTRAQPMNVRPPRLFVIDT
jgi:hypothetical protein